MGAWFPLVPGSLTFGLSVLIGTLSLTTRYDQVSIWKASHGQSSLPDTTTYMEVLLGREDFPCEAFRIATDEDLVVRERFPSRTERPSVREPGTNGNHAPIGQAQNDISSANSQEIPVSMENVCPEGTEDQYVTSPSG